MGKWLKVNSKYGTRMLVNLELVKTVAENLDGTIRVYYGDSDHSDCDISIESLADLLSQSMDGGEGEMNRLEKFLQELSELTQKHGFSIAGCGCCGSPWIDDFQSEFDAENLGYNQEKQKYEVEYIRSPKKGGESNA